MAGEVSYNLKLKRNRMGDASVDTGNIGSTTEDLAGELIGDRSNAEAVLFFGLASLILSFGSMFMANFLGANFTWAAAGAGWFASNVKWFLPAGMCWILLSFFDNDFTRAVFRDLAAATLIGPFYSHWASIVGIYWSASATASNLVSPGFYIWLAIFTALTVFEQVVQVLLLPQVFDWI